LPADQNTRGRGRGDCDTGNTEPEIEEVLRDRSAERMTDEDRRFR
jgi:hypothetical protein